MSVLGFAPWSPRQESIDLVSQVKEILLENREYLPLTGRQIFYMLVGQYGYSKTERAYHRLLDKLNRARRARLISFSSIRDDGVTEVGAGGWNSHDEWLESLIYSAKLYRKDRQDGQDQRVEVWVEAAGMVPQIARVCSRFGIPVFSSGGFNSTTMKHDAAQRFAASDRETVVLHIGDHDPSGVAIFENLSVDIPSFCWSLVYRECCRWQRIAVTEDQIERYDLEEAPPKRTDSRSVTWIGGTVQVEAMRPEQLAKEVEQSIVRLVDMDTLEGVVDQEASERETLISRLEEMLVG